MTTSRKVFVRDATGLVRQFSSFDALMISCAAIVPGIWAFSSQIAFVTSADPGADIAGTVHLGFLFTLPLAITYVLLAIAMPRSGGDYVWATRLVSPVVGFMAGWGIWVAIESVVGIITFAESAVVLSTFFASFGYATNNPSLVGLASAVTQPLPVAVIGITVLVVASILGGVEARIFRTAMIVIFSLIVLSTLTCLLVLASSTHADFVSAFEGFGGATYAGVISQAQSAGWSYAPVSVGATLLGTPLAVLLFAGQNLSAIAAGEIKTIRRSMFTGIVGSLVLSWAIAALGISLCVGVFGYDFIQAATFKWPLAAVPWVPLLITPLTHGNLAVLTLIQLGWLISLPWGAIGALVVNTRYVFAFSFDRVFPVRFADVSDRFHFPVKSMILNFLVACVFFFLAAFTSYLGLFLNASAIYSIVWAIGSICAVVLPFRKKQLAAILPGSTWKIPLVSLLGAISTVLMLVSFYWNVTTPAVGPSTPQADAILITILVVGLLVFYASRSYRKREGIDLNQVYAEIPPE